MKSRMASPGSSDTTGYCLSMLSVEASGELLFAPTSPLSVALAPRAAAQGPATGRRLRLLDNYFAGDSDLDLRPVSGAIPAARIRVPGEWLESGYAPYPWRRYLPTSERSRLRSAPVASGATSRGESSGSSTFTRPTRTSAGRSALRSSTRERRPHPRCTAALVEPAVQSSDGRRGAATASCVRAAAAAADDEETGELGTDLDIFMGLTPEEGQPSDAAMEVMKRLTYTKGSRR